MTTDLTTTPVTVINPSTGEALTVDSPTADLGQFLADIRDFEGLIREQKNLVTRELVNRMDFSKEYTVRLPNGLKLSAPASGQEEQWDGATLREALLELVDAGELAITAVDAAVEVQVVFKVKKAGVNALRKSGRTREIVDELVTVVEKPRYVSVSRAT